MKSMEGWNKRTTQQQRWQHGNMNVSMNVEKQKWGTDEKHTEFW